MEFENAFIKVMLCGIYKCLQVVKIGNLIVIYYFLKTSAFDIFVFGN
jgi:hypothetical protein